MSSDETPGGLTHALLLGVLLISFALRLGWGLSRPSDDQAIAGLPDQVEYLTLARNVLNGQGLSFVDPRFGSRVYAFRMPGYPLFIAGCHADVRTVRAVQALLDTSTVLAVYLLARRVLGANSRRAALFAGAIVAVNPLLIYFSGLILSETLFVAILMWGIVLLVAGFGFPGRPGRARVWICGGFLLALSVLIRPSGALLPVVLGVGALLMNQRGGTAYGSSAASDAVGRWPIPVATTILLLVGLVLLPWALRNYRTLHHLVWTDTNSGITLYDGYNPDATGASDQQFIKRMPQLRVMDELGRSQYLSLAALDFVRKHSDRIPELALAKAARTWSPVPLSDQFGSTRNRMILLLYSIPFDLLVVAGLCFGNMPRGVKAFLLIPAIYLTIVHALTVGSLRYRVPAEPALAIIAAGTFHRTMLYGEKAA